MTDLELFTLTARFGTPLYLFEEEALRRRAKAARRLLGQSVRLCYSIKANPFLVPEMARLTDAVEVCSPGEMNLCERYGVPPARIVLSGVSKSQAEITRALTGGVGTFTAESALQLSHICAAARAAGRRVSVLLRLSSGNQFGLDEASLLALAHEYANEPSVELCGLHYFSGTQKRSPAVLEAEMDRLEAVGRRLEALLGREHLQLEYGPGLGIDYFGKFGGEAAELALLDGIAAHLAALAAHFVLTVEMGRWFTARCGTYLTTVTDCKQTAGVRYAIVDGGIHQLNYYGQTMAMQVPPLRHIACSGMRPQESAVPWTLCGSLCTAADVLVRSVPLAGLTVGDVLAFGCCGAYSVTEAPALFLSRALPAVLLCRADGTQRLLRPRIATDNLNSGAENSGVL